MEDDDSVVVLLCGFHINSVLYKPCIYWKLKKVHELVMIAYLIPTLFFFFFLFVHRTNEDDSVRNH